jgi:hypothetical protein
MVCSACTRAHKSATPNRILRARKRTGEWKTISVYMCSTAATVTFCALVNSTRNRLPSFMALAVPLVMAANCGGILVGAQQRSTSQAKCRPHAGARYSEPNERYDGLKTASHREAKGGCVRRAVLDDRDAALPAQAIGSTHTSAPARAERSAPGRSATARCRSTHHTRCPTGPAEHLPRPQSGRRAPRVMRRVPTHRRLRIPSCTWQLRSTRTPAPRRERERGASPSEAALLAFLVCVIDCRGGPFDPAPAQPGVQRPRPRGRLALPTRVRLALTETQSLTLGRLRGRRCGRRPPRRARAQRRTDSAHTHSPRGRCSPGQDVPSRGRTAHERTRGAAAPAERLADRTGDMARVRLSEDDAQVSAAGVRARAWQRSGTEGRVRGRLGARGVSFVRPALSAPSPLRRMRVATTSWRPLRSANVSGSIARQ